MQEKIEKILRNYYVLDDVAIPRLAAEIAALFEGKVIWDRDIVLEEDVDSPGDVAGWSELDDDYVVYFIDPNPNLPLDKPVRVRVEEIDESRT